MIEYERLTRRGQIRRLREVARQALTRYGLEPASLSLLAHVFNTTFNVTGPDGARYVLHITRQEEEVLPETQRRARAESELWWLDHLRTELDLAVPHPARTPAGEGVVVVPLPGSEATLLCTLFHWVEGRFVGNHLRPWHLQAVGSLMARLHESSAQLRVPAWFDRPLVDVADDETEEEVVALFAEHVSPEAAGVMQAAFQRVRRAQEELGTGPGAFGLIHADIHQRNYLFQGRDVRLIDFGDCGWAHYLYDPAVTLSEIAGLPNGIELRAALLAGYRRVRELTPAHEAMIHIFIVLREVQNVTWFLRFRHDPTYSKWAGQIEARVAAIERMLSAMPL